MSNAMNSEKGKAGKTQPLLRPVKFRSASCANDGAVEALARRPARPTPGAATDVTRRIVSAVVNHPPSNRRPILREVLLARPWRTGPRPLRCRYEVVVLTTAPPRGTAEWLTPGGSQFPPCAPGSSRTMAGRCGTRIACG